MLRNRADVVKNGDQIAEFDADFSASERADLAAVPEQFRVNMDQLAHIVGRTTNTIRSDMGKHSDKFPVVVRGSNGVGYVFDARAVTAFYTALAEEEEARRVADEERIRGLRLDLMGGSSVDEETATLSPKERRETLQAEYFAAQLQQQRGELVRAAAVEDAARVWNARVRDEMLAAAGRIAEDLALDREASRKVEMQIVKSLRQAASSAAKAFKESGVVADVC